MFKTNIKKLDILTLFPDIIKAYLAESIIKRAIDSKKINIDVHNIRDCTEDKHHQVDDVPYGGSTGMVLQPGPIKKTLDKLRKKNTCVIVFSPVGNTLNMDIIKELLAKPHLILISGHYEGIDRRVDNYVDRKISVGDYVLTGGELPALLLSDALIRLLPGVLGNTNSFQEDSFFNNLLDWDVYTRPKKFENFTVPDILLSGNHKKIERWKKRSAIINTLRYKPDLLARHKPDEEEEKIIKHYFLEEDCDE
ncbi:MAG: tRNA (guanosine(37)-N1)-methyltransferase TrmD [Candidatus Margulisbacteria bacterium]|nr:tRNA (guanosine(37)-N1)-methyltransferase TrmD [Candidatus Margulisiibacteriota bacterium]